MATVEIPSVGYLRVFNPDYIIEPTRTSSTSYTGTLTDTLPYLDTSTPDFRTTYTNATITATGLSTLGTLIPDFRTSCTNATITVTGSSTATYRPYLDTFGLTEDNNEYQSRGYLGVYGTGYNIIPTSDYTLYSELDSRTKKKIKLKSNLFSPQTVRFSPHDSINKYEQIALESLREIVTEREFRKYLKYGFILVRGKSGATYQVFKNRSHTKVWKGGILIEEICVHLSSAFNAPPTDKAIAFKTMIEADEDEFKKAGNVYRMAKAA